MMSHAQLLHRDGVLLAVALRVLLRERAGVHQLDALSVQQRLVFMQSVHVVFRVLRGRRRSRKSRVVAGQICEFGRW